MRRKKCPNCGERKAMTSKQRYCSRQCAGEHSAQRLTPAFLAERARLGGIARAAVQRQKREARFAHMIATLGVDAAMRAAYAGGYRAGYMHRRNLELREIAQAYQARRRAERAA